MVLVFSVFFTLTFCLKILYLIKFWWLLKGRKRKYVIFRTHVYGYPIWKIGTCGECRRFVLSRHGLPFEMSRDNRPCCHSGQHQEKLVSNGAAVSEEKQVEVKLLTGETKICKRTSYMIVERA
ncbi:unnamed protein product [Lactuca virosa]|uniref:FLZ-type domain-containing protein n=1 Tax=Lactuca virosa TaxID=75947 RepID=A0AAU9NVR8_9ASTR|nr:unnamed protein product [Lactuca virosa]